VHLAEPFIQPTIITTMPSTGLLPTAEAAAPPAAPPAAAQPSEAPPAADDSDDFAPPPAGTTGSKQKITRPRSGVRDALGYPKASQLPYDTLFEMQRDFLLQLGRRDKCPKLANGGGHCKCSCVKIFQDESICDAVATWCIRFFKKKKYDQQQTIIDWFKYAMLIGSKGQPKFLLPSDTSEAFLTPDAEGKMKNCLLCLSALGAIVDYGQYAMTGFKKLALTTGCAKVHGNTGKQNRRYREDSPEVIWLRRHFLGLERLGEVRATRLISRLVADRIVNSIRDDEEDIVFLPACNSKRSCYERYLNELGWYVTQTHANGKMDIEKLAGVEEHHPIVCFTTYLNFWKREYSYLRVSKPSEDLCPICFRYSNRHRHLADHSSRLVVCPEVAGDDNEGDALCPEVAGDDNEGDEESPGLEEEEEDDDSDDDLACTVEVRRSGRKKKARNLQAHYCYEDESDDEEDGNEDDDDLDAEGAAEKPAAVNLPPSTVELTEDDTADVFSEEISKTEELLIEAATHVEQARVQRWLYNSYIIQAIEDAKDVKDHSFRCYCLVVDYGQNMELPLFNGSQPGTTYYYSPLSVYNLGVVDHAHKYDGIDQPTHHMYAHVYHEGVGKKGSNCVASLIMKTLRMRNIIREDQIGGHLVIAFDNCSGQNKNNTIIRLLMYLYEMRYFKKITFLFLIVGHTKNAADRLFNSLKKEYHNKNIFTMGQLNGVLGRSKFVTVVPAEKSDFMDFSKYLNYFYRKQAAEIKVNHLFSLGSMEDGADGCQIGEDLEISLRESDREVDKEKKKKCIKTGWYKGLPGRNYTSRQEALMNRVEDLKSLKDELLLPVEEHVMNVYKKAELAEKYKEFVPTQYHDDELYQPLTEEEKGKLKIEAKMNHDKKIEVANMKKRKLKDTLDNVLNNNTMV
jgi:hypothetical protein